MDDDHQRRKKAGFSLNYFPWKTTAASIQWLLFIFTNTVVVPISIGAAFDLDPVQLAGVLRSSLLFTGIACILQGWIGHRLPIMEGHSGVMWGLVLNLCFSASAMGMDLIEVGGGIATGLLLAGGLILLLGITKQLSIVEKIFTPMVVAVYLFLLTFQLVLIFFEGMLKISADGTLQLPVTLFSFVIVAFVSLLKIKGSPTIGNFSILIGIGVGWILYVVLFPVDESIQHVTSSWKLPIFPLGTPNLNVGIAGVTFLASLINMSNTIASVKAAAELLRKQVKQQMFNRSYMLGGFFSMVAACLGLVAYAPFASTIGFLESTRIFDRKPFLIGGILMTVLGIFPFLGGLLATMPVTVGNAVLFVAYLQLMGTSLKSIQGLTFNSVTIHRLALPVLVGLSILTLDPALFRGLPVMAQAIISNGFIVGVLLSILLEKLLKWEN